jgi:hypothetical protein
LHQEELAMSVDFMIDGQKTRSLPSVVTGTGSPLKMVLPSSLAPVLTLAAA